MAEETQCCGVCVMATGNERVVFRQDVVVSPDGLQMIAAADEVFNHVDTGEFMWTGSGGRRVEIPISFARPFVSTPLVVLGLTGIDSSQSENLRFNLTAEDVSGQGFTIVFVTWDDTRIARASASWTAIGREVVTRKPAGGPRAGAGKPALAGSTDSG